MSSNKSLNILHIASWYPSRVHSTLGNFVQRHIQAISTLHTCTVLYLVHDSSLSEKFSLETRDDGKVKEIVCYYKERGVLGIGYSKAFKYLVKNELKDVIPNTDLVHIHVLYKAGILGLKLKKKFGLSYIITEHWNGYHRDAGKDIGIIKKIISRKIARNASAIVPVSGHLADAMQTFGLESKYHVVPNVVNHDIFKLSKTKNNQFTFIHVSSLIDDHKNVSGIIRGFSKVKDSLNATLQIIGDGDIAPYEKLANELGLQKDKFSITGEKTIYEVAEFMAKAHCLILFSNYENQPCVIPEAHSCGLPVIATNVGGISEHLTEKHGELIEKGSSEQLEKAMLEIHADYSGYDPHWLRKYSKEYFSVNAVAKKYSEIYHSNI